MDIITKAPELIDLPAREVLTVDGAGSPEASEFQAAIRGLVVVRAALGADDAEPFEGSYWQAGDPGRFDLEDPDGWQWRLLAPAPADAEADAVAAVRAGAPVELRRQEGRRVARLLHEGPYADEGPVARRRLRLRQGAGSETGRAAHGGLPERPEPDRPGRPPHDRPGPRPLIRQDR